MKYNINDLYLEDRNEADTVEERDRVWRMYMMSVMREFSRRSVSNMNIKWRRAAGDDDLPQEFLPFWRLISDDDLRTLHKTLLRARVK
ncbi:hypothetical protein [Sphingomonas sp. CFBP 13706]|uniref:hypothetical protein n=1 Tax=Sphingomonas sp. CFBP 13706 TaxID=2775314 RepID=UPI00177B234C|nr:hypothetical protein [Sphingomonas sp. CFBP 13706]MBD8734924.1 hypothetical protein [Sphingomonas sp. CFBP 13706]